jgi:hypothetical protein
MNIFKEFKLFLQWRKVHTKFALTENLEFGLAWESTPEGYDPDLKDISHLVREVYNSRTNKRYKILAHFPIGDRVHMILEKEATLERIKKFK